MEPINCTLSDHAMKDTVPLRFGINPPRYVVLKNLEFDEIATARQKPVEIKKGNQHHVADCYDAATDTFLFRGKFVIGLPQNNAAHKSIVTVLSLVPDKSERAVSDLIMHLRKTGKIDSDFIISKLHQKYKAAEISSSEDFYSYLVELGVQERVNDLNDHISNIEKENDALRFKREELEKKSELDRIRIVALEKQKPSYRGEGVSLSPVCTLKSVTTGNITTAKGKSVVCVYLKFEEPVPERKMYNIFDPTGEIAVKATALVGQKVQTTSWKPESFPPLNWFRNIYPVI